MPAYQIIIGLIVVFAVTIFLAVIAYKRGAEDGYIEGYKAGAKRTLDEVKSVIQNNREGVE